MSGWGLMVSGDALIPNLLVKIIKVMPAQILPFLPVSGGCLDGVWLVSVGVWIISGGV